MPKTAKGELPLLQNVAQLDKLIQQKRSAGHPGSYGMPDLLFQQGYTQGRYAFSPEGELLETQPGEELFQGWLRTKLAQEETEEEYDARRYALLKKFVETLYIVKDADRIMVKTIPDQIRFIGDILFGKVSKAILWKPRGGGGSLSASVLIFLLMIYRKISIMDVGGSAEQSKVIYTYVKQLWNCIPLMRGRLLDGEPLTSETRLTTGVILKCIPATEKQSRGKHIPCVVIDEACQSNGCSERALRACIQGVASEKNPIIILLSTFHLPTGLFQEYWDQADEKGFKRYRWDCFDTMEKCTRGLETATPEDPYAKKFCLGCFLTYPHKVINEAGAEVSGKMAGCQGKARLSSGWAAFDSIVESRKNNLGTNIFEVEFANERPNYAGSIYDAELVDAARVPAEVLSGFTAAAVGIDWGIETENSLCVTLGLRKLEYIYLAEAVYWDHKLVTDVAVLLNSWRNALKINFPVLADSSHPFNNTELSQAGFDVRPVIFGTWKKVGIQNVSKYLVFRRIKINVALTRMIGQMKEYRKNETSGAIVKKNDHGPDSLMSLLLNFRFEDEFGPDIEQAAVLEEQTRKMAADQFVKPPYSFKDDGLKAPTVMTPPVVPGDKNRSGVLVF